MSFDFKLQNADIQIGANGDIATVESSEKLTQDILKIISTPRGGNVFFPWYGSPISQSLVGTAFETKFISAMASEQLRTSLETLQSLQEEQQKDPAQVVTAQEQIAAITNINVSRNVTDPRFFNVTLTVLSKAFRRVQTNLRISL